MKKYLLSAAVLGAFSSTFAQGTLSGDIMSNVNFFENDPKYIEANNPLYERYKTGGEGWLSLRYNQNGFTGFLRVDAFQNSNLKYLTSPMTTFGVGAFSLSKDIQDLSVTAGYIYDQIGSGILFRSYEDRGLLIDNALVGISMKYRINDHIFVKGMAGQQKDNNLVNKFYAPIFKSFTIEGDFSAGEVHLTPGAATLNRTLDQNSMDEVAATINASPLEDRFVPKYNMYAFTAYNNLTYQNLSWYVEGAYKSTEAISVNGKLQNHDGSTLYSTLGWARKGIAVNGAVKRTENFVMRTSPSLTLLNGMVNWQPVVAIIRPHRLLARYSPASQDLSEMAYRGDVLLAPNDDYNINLNYTHTNKLNGEKLYREIFGDFEYRGFKRWILGGGIQYLEYNLGAYRTEFFVQPMMFSVTPFVEATYRIDDKHAIRTEWEYQDTKQDLGSWLFGLVEFTVAPRWSFALSDMYNIKPTDGREKLHYYNVFAAYTKGPHRFSLAYVKQVAGINCTGGVCRYEPAFSGVRAMITSSF
ncbi:MAG: hypothetical protein JNL13_14825 [Chitinophagaceae bacterium]|nr:hypothetical protein [Chitinophagaceae bacterium]